MRLLEAVQSSVDLRVTGSKRKQQETMQYDINQPPLLSSDCKSSSPYSCVLGHRARSEYMGSKLAFPQAPDLPTRSTESGAAA
jgi:hypothetical protein